MSKIKRSIKIRHIKTRAPFVTIVLTLFGAFVQNRGGTIAMGGLIRMIRPLGLSENAVRLGLSRLSRRGIIAVRKYGRESRLSLTRKGYRYMEEGRQWAFEQEPKEWDGQWRVLIYSIPESMRRSRATLRERLRETGCGSLGASAWISPYDFNADILLFLKKTRLSQYTEFFKASYTKESTAKDFAMRVWGIHDLEKQYKEFLRIYKPLLVYYGNSIKRKRAVDTEACFALRFQLMSEYIAIRLRDPMLPLALLPCPWAGAVTQKLLSGYWHLLSTEANKFVDAVFAGTRL